jgi:leucyl-tRNA---protein transferase
LKPEDNIYDTFFSSNESKESMDELLSLGFRHFGTNFFRYNLNIHNGEFVNVLPLRIDLKKFQFSKSNKKLFKKNRFFSFVFRNAFVDREKEELFSNHALRFTENRPTSLYDFLSKNPASVPCETKECCVYDVSKLVAYSFLDIGQASTSSIYGVFDPAYSKNSLGIYTMLLEIQYSLEKNMRYYYPGYAYKQNSFYDYKKKFNSLEYFDWIENWHPLSS